MAGLSRVAWALLDQLTSTDLTTSFRLGARDVLDALRYLVQERSVVLGGLIAAAGPGGVTIGPGMVLEPFSGSAGAPGAEDSPFVLGRLGAATTVPIPVPVADAWHLVQARALELELSGARSRWNPGTREFDTVSTTIRREQQLELGLKVGSPTAIPAPDSGWLSVCAVMRRAAGGAVAQADVLDLRPLPFAEQPAGAERFLAQDYVVLRTGRVEGEVPTVRLEIEVIDRNGVRMVAKHHLLPIADILAADTPLSMQSYLYLYLSPLRGVAVPTATGKGLLVASGAAPLAQGVRQNGAPIPGPYGYTIGMGEATCVGVLRTDSSLPVGLVPQHCTRGRYVVGSNLIELTYSPTLSAGHIPRNARTMTLRARITGEAEVPVNMLSPSALDQFNAALFAYSSVRPGTSGTRLRPFPLQGVNTSDIKLTGLPGGSLLYLEECDL